MSDPITWLKLWDTIKRENPTGRQWVVLISVLALGAGTIFTSGIQWQKHSADERLSNLKAEREERVLRIEEEPDLPSMVLYDATATPTPAVQYLYRDADGVLHDPNLYRDADGVLHDRH